MIENYLFDCEVIAASIRHPQHVSTAINNNIDIVTVPYPILEQMMKHPLTDIGIENSLKTGKNHKQNKNKKG